MTNEKDKALSGEKTDIPQRTTVKCGTRQLGTMTAIVGCGQQSCRCRVGQKCATCGATFYGLEMLGDPQCSECFEKELFAEPWPDVPDDGIDGLEAWLS